MVYNYGTVCFVQAYHMFTLLILMILLSQGNACIHLTVGFMVPSCYLKRALKISNQILMEANDCHAQLHNIYRHITKTLIHSLSFGIELIVLISITRSQVQHWFH